MECLVWSLLVSLSVFGLSFSSSPVTIEVIMVEEGKYGASTGRRRRGEVIMAGSYCVFMIINFRFERIIH